MFVDKHCAFCSDVQMFSEFAAAHEATSQRDGEQDAMRACIFGGHGLFRARVIGVLHAAGECPVLIRWGGHVVGMQSRAR